MLSQYRLDQVWIIRQGTSDYSKGIRANPDNSDATPLSTRILSARYAVRQTVSEFEAGREEVFRSR
jgi:hypothetical protein